MTATANVANTKVHPSSTIGTPFWDDFDESKNFHRFLFRPGFAVQGRELTQLQTMLQAQIERFGNHIFQNGSIVAGGEISLIDALHLNLQSTYANTDVVASDFVNKTIGLSSSSNNIVQAYVIGASEADSTNPPTLVVKYLSGIEFANGDTIKVNSESTYANLVSANANGVALTASISDGLFFINGFFVKCPKQTIVVDNYKLEANARIGLEFDQNIITELNDTSLLDPAQEATNYQAPGAARLTVELSLAKRDLDSVDDSQFIELMRVERGIVQKAVVYPLYSDIGETLARRTNDESGPYTVRPFKISLDDHPTDDTKLQATISPGKAYIKGYEYESIAQKYLDIDRARDFDSVNGFDISMNYGNYCIVKELRGPFRPDTMATCDIHCIPYQNVNTAALGYASTKIGTGRIRNITYDGGSNTANSNTRTYRLAIFDTQFSNLVGRANICTSNSFTIQDNTGVFTATNDAYKNASVRIYSGAANSATKTYLISGYDGATKNVKILTSFTATPDGTSNISIDFDFSDAESFVISSLTPGGPSERANANIDTTNKYGGDVNADSFLSETTLNALVFPFPQNFIKTGSITDQQFSYRKRFAGSFSSGSLTITVTTPDEQFAASNGVSTGTSTTVLSNFLVMRDDNGMILPLTQVTVNNGTGSAVLLATDGTFGGSVTVFATVSINSGSNVNPKKKSLTTGNTSAYVGSASDGKFLTNNGTQNTVVYLTPGQDIIINPSQTPGEKMSLYVSDVKAVTQIKDLNGAAIPAVGASLSSYSDVTTKYTFNTGQKDSHYDHAFITLNPRTVVPKGPLIITYDWYEHIQGDTSDTLGYFDVDSYPTANTTLGYKSIPSYTMADGTILALRDCIDFRPKRANASNTNPNYTLSGIRIPIPNGNFEADFSYHLPRIDFIVITTNVNLLNPFMVVEGTPSLFPQEPMVPSDSMLIYKLMVPAYTLSPANVNLTFVENKRFTMRDIGTLETRIENLEYYVTLSLLEKASADMVILDSDGLERSKYGVLVDNFSTSGIGDVFNTDYNIAIEKTYGALVPSQNTVAMKLVTTSFTNAVKRDQITTLDYTEVELASQPYATKYNNVQPYAFAQFIGLIDMNPEFDMWVETTRAPDVVININGVNDHYIECGPQQQRCNTHNNAFTCETNWWKLHYCSAQVQRNG